MTPLLAPWLAAMSAPLLASIPAAVPAVVGRLAATPGFAGAGVLFMLVAGLGAGREWMRRWYE